MYLLFSVLLLMCWLAVFYTQKKLRKEMLIGSLLISPFAILQIFYFPGYWIPDSIISPRLSIEDFIFCFSIGGIITTCYEIFMRGAVKHKRLHHSLKNETSHLLPLGISAVILFISYYLLEINFMYASYIAMVVTILLILLFRFDLWKKIIYSGIIFGVFYFIFLFTSIKIFLPNFIDLWSLNNLSNVLILGIPLEEIIWAVLAGASLGPLYEYVLSYKLVSTKK